MSVRWLVGEDGALALVQVSAGGQFPPAPAGLVIADIPPPGPNYRWDTETSAWVAVPVVPSMTVAEIIKAFTPDQRAALLASTKIQAFMWGAQADEIIAADNPLFAEAVQVAVSEQLLGSDTQAQIEAALAPLLS